MVAAAALESLARLRRVKWAAERGLARARFVLERRKRLAPLSAEQVQRYQRDGYLLVSGLIPEGLLSGAEAAMWQALGAAPHAPETWATLGPQPHWLPHEPIVALYTDAMMAAAAQLVGQDVATFTRPTRVLTVNRVPVSRGWGLAEMRHGTFPRRQWISTITHLTHVRRHGGGTIVWPGSHLELEAVARKNPVKYKYLSSLNSELERVVLAPAVEMTPSRGDVFFHHHLCVHASSDNVSGTPRLAVKHTW